MAFLKKTAYTGIETDDDESGHARNPPKRDSRSSTIARLKLKTRTQDSARQLASWALSKDSWQSAPSRTKVFVQEGIADLKTIRWRRRCYQVSIFVWPILFMIALVVILPVISSNNLYQVTSACQPDSGFHVGYDGYNIWAISGFFQITLAYGRLSFTAAKIVTVCWDIIVGRGGQALLVIVSYIVYTRALVRSMETSTVSYGTFEAITLQNGSFTSLLKLSRDLLKNRTVRARVTIVWFIISGSFVLSFQTLVSAMAGYTANIEAYVVDPTGNMERYSNFQLVRYIVHDAFRINDTLGSDYHVLTGGTDSNGNSDVVQLMDDYADLCSMTRTVEAIPFRNGTEVLTWVTTGDVDCSFYWHVSEYGSNYGFLGLNQTRSTFNYSGTLVELEAPSLNITALFWKQYTLDEYPDEQNFYSTLPWYDWPSGYFWTTSTGEQPFHKIVDPTFTNGEFTYGLEDINLNGKCQQIQSTYKWGFSFLVLFSVIILFLVWTLGMYILWVDAHLNSRFNRAGRTLGIQRAALDLAHCIQKDLGTAGIEMTSNAELQNKIRGELRGGRITYQLLEEKMLPITRGTQFRNSIMTRHELWSWAKDHRYSLGLFVCSCFSGILAAALAAEHAPLVSLSLMIVGSATATFMGDVHNGRWLILCVCVILAIMLAPVGPCTTYPE